LDLTWATEHGPNAFIDPFPDTTSLAPTAAVCMGCKSLWGKSLLMKAFRSAEPMAIINHTGGLANLFGEMLVAVNAVMNNN